MNVGSLYQIARAQMATSSREHDGRAHSLYSTLSLGLGCRSRLCGLPHVLMRVFTVPMRGRRAAPSSLRWCIALDS